MSDLIKREDAIKAVFGLTMYKGRVPVNSVIFNIKKIPAANAKMSKYIERSKAKDEIVRVLEHTDCKDEYIDRVLMAISALPTIEVSAVPTISKMEQVDKPQLTPNYCGTCKHREVSCGDLPCDVCHGYSHYEPTDEPQTDCNGCKFVGTYDTEFPCVNCTRKTKDYYTKDEP